MPMYPIYSVEFWGLFKREMHAIQYQNKKLEMAPYACFIIQKLYGCIGRRMYKYTGPRVPERGEILSLAFETMNKLAQKMPPSEIPPDFLESRFLEKRFYLTARNITMNYIRMHYPKRLAYFLSIEQMQEEEDFDLVDDQPSVPDQVLDPARAFLEEFVFPGLPQKRIDQLLGIDTTNAATTFSSRFRDNFPTKAIIEALQRHIETAIQKAPPDLSKFYIRCSKLLEEDTRDPAHVREFCARLGQPDLASETVLKMNAFLAAVPIERLMPEKRPQLETLLGFDVPGSAHKHVGQVYVKDQGGKKIIQATPGTRIKIGIYIVEHGKIVDDEPEKQEPDDGGRT